MEQDVFTAGLVPGAPTSEFEVKFLICYMLDELGCPVSFNQLAVTFQKTGLVNYFEFSGVVSELLENGYLVSEGGEGLVYKITEYGRSAAKSFYDKVPPAVRERALSALKKQLCLEKRIQENRFVAEKTEDGYRVTLEIPDIGTPLLTVSMFVPDKELCEEIRRRFLNDPLTLYKGVVALTTGDVRSIAPLLPSGEDLFI